MHKMAIRVTQLRQADLNLLIYLPVLVEERSISRAAKRLRLSQPAVSRALERLRELFGDDLLVRTPQGYEATVRGVALLGELTVLLPQLDRLISGTTFNPMCDAASFRIAATDNAARLLGARLAQECQGWEAVSIAFQAWSNDRFAELERNRLDLVLDAAIQAIPPELRSELLFTDEFVCVAAKESVLPPKLSLEQYLAAGHVCIDVLHGRQILVEDALLRLHTSRRCRMTVPYFTVAMRMVVGTDLLVTLPKRLAMMELDPETMRLLKPPRELGGFDYLMCWHGRQDKDAQHGWLRETVRAAAATLGD